jgi:hypothetical protein
MKEFIDNKKEMHISIPIANLEEVDCYKRSILHLLSKIEIESSDSAMRESVKNVYKLLMRMITVKG